MPPLPTSKQQPPPATLCLPGDPGTAPYVLPASGRPAMSTQSESSPTSTSNATQVFQDSPLYLPGRQRTQPFIPASTGTGEGGSAPATAQSATTGARPFQTPFAWLPAAKNTTTPFSVSTSAAHHGQAAQAGQAFDTAHEEMAPFWMVAAPRRDAQPPNHEAEDAFRRRHQYPDDGLRGMPAVRTTAPTGNSSTGTKRKASDAPARGMKRSRTNEATASTAQSGMLPPPAAGFTGVGFAGDSNPLSVLTWSDTPANASAVDTLDDSFLQEMTYLFADAPLGGALPFANGFSGQPLLQSTSAPPAGSAQRDLMPAQSIAAANARKDTASAAQRPQSYALGNFFLPEMDDLFANAPVGGALPLTDGFSAPPRLVPSTSVPPAPTSPRRDLTPAQLIAAAKARLGNDAMGGDLPLLLPGTAAGRTSGAEADTFATGSGSAAVKITPETKRRIHEAEAEMLRALEIAPPKDSGPMEHRVIVCTYVDLVVFSGRPVMMSAHLDAQKNNTILPHGQLQVPQAGQSDYFAKQEAAKREREAAKEARFLTTKRGRATQLVRELQYNDGQLLPFCELCNAEKPEGRLLHPYKNEDRLIDHYASKHL